MPNINYGGSTAGYLNAVITSNNDYQWRDINTLVQEYQQWMGQEVAKKNELSNKLNQKLLLLEEV